MSDTNSDTKQLKKLRLFDVLCLSFAATYSIELVASHAAIGPSTIMYLAVLGTVYVLVHGMISAELGSTYPSQGGSYVWVKKAFGDRWAARVTWWGWSNTVSFVPSVFVVCVIILMSIFELDLSAMDIALISIVGTWIVVIINCFTLEESKIVTNIGSALKVVVIVALVGGAIWYVAGNGFANDITFETIMPTFDIGVFGLIGTFVYGLTGLDIISCNAGNMANPRRDIPVTVIAVGISCILLYLISSIAVMAVLPLEAIDVSAGMIDALVAIYGFSRLAVIALGLILIIVFISYTFSWTIGGNVMAQVAAEDGEMPAVFGYSSKKGAPVGAAILMGIGSTALLLFYGLTSGSGDELFWMLLAFTSVTFFFPYFLIAFALPKLRKSDPATPRPFKIPGKVFPYVIIAIDLLLLTIGLVAFLVPPEGDTFVSYTVFIFVCIVVMQALGEFLISYAVRKSRQKQIESAQG